MQNVDFNLGLLLLGRIVVSNNLLTGCTPEYWLGMKVVDEIDIILFLYGRKLIMNDNIVGQTHH